MCTYISSSASNNYQGKIDLADLTTYMHMSKQLSGQNRPCAFDHIHAYVKTTIKATKSLQI